MSKASVYFSLANLSGKHDVKEIKRELDTLNGVISVSVNDQTDSVAVDFDTTGVSQERLEKRLQDMGFNITDRRFENHIM